MKSALEETFVLQLRTAGLQAGTDYKREQVFHAGRRWRFDFAFLMEMVAVEIEGGVWTGGRHTRGKGFIGDCEKYNTAALDGWLVLRFTSEHLADLTALDQTLEALRRRGRHVTHDG